MIMENVENLMMGFQVALTATNVLSCLVGVIVGVIIGALPGFGPSTGVAILLPMTFGMDPATSLIMMCGIYYGAMFGGAITAILINTPGDSAAVMTSLDGYPLAKNGRAGPALGMSTIASFIGGTFGIIMLTLISPIIARFAISFGPPEYFALMALGLTTLASMTGSNPSKGFIMALLGLFLSVIGSDTMTGMGRFVFGIPALWSGIDFIPVVMGFFGFAEILVNCEQALKLNMQTGKISFRNVIPTKQDMKDSTPALIRGSVLGFIIGCLPGAGATIASFISYSTAKKLSKHPEKFGTGVIEGVAAPESANNAGAAGAMVPLLTLGLPGSGTTAVMLGALMMLGLRPGPLLFRDNPQFVFAVIAAMYVGNVILVILNLGGIPAFVRILKIPYSIMMPCIMIFLILGCYSLELQMSDVWIMFVSGVAGYFLKKIDYPGPPLVLSLVLGSLTERALRQSLQISHGSFGIFVHSPICVVLLVISAGFILRPIYTSLRRSVGKKVAT